jgi:hypothetical protein
LTWRVHCRACEDCRTELFILETLQRQAVEERRHLGRREVDALLLQVRSHQAKQRRVPVVWDWAYRLASVCVVVLAVGLVHRQVSRDRASAGYLGRAGDGQPLASSEVIPRRTAAASGLDADAAGRLDPRLEPRLRQVRGQVMSRRGRLLKLMETDLGESERQDVWDVAAAPVSGPA